MFEAKPRSNLPGASPSGDEEQGTDASRVGEGQVETASDLIACSGVSKPASPTPSSADAEEETADLIMERSCCTR